MVHRFNPDKAEKLVSNERYKDLPPEETLAPLQLQQGDIVADFGAGNGFFTLPIAQATGATVYAVDIETRMLAALKQRADENNIGNIERVEADLAETGLATHSVDKLFSSFVLHEVPDLSATLKEMKRVLRPGGAMLILDWEAVEGEDGPPKRRRIPSERLQSDLVALQFNVRKITINPDVYALQCTLANE
ncbi:class I SAM-dependent methyltransferase [Camelliibacillus cellulosilyticus]|uniref:Class I SAM-dependent methyltransferase n=1 Tax=Camelliibacillus cellulosilyticus TaxID=2174486 RepID=A0ABV9GL05_9BACL